MLVLAISIYLIDDNFNLLARQIPALVFLPVNMVRDTWSNLKMQFSNDKNEQQLVSYFDENYFNSKIRMRYRNNRTPTRNEPIFPPKMWFVSLTLTGTPRTLSSAEKDSIIKFTVSLQLILVYADLSEEYKKSRRKQK